MKTLQQHIFAFSILVLTSFQLFSTPLSLNGNWLDADNNKMNIMQKDGLFILSRQTVKMNGTVIGTRVNLVMDNSTLTGTISADNLIITWSNGSQWYREISGVWSNESKQSKNVEQAGNIVRIKNAKGEVEYLGFLKDNAFTIISKTNNSSITGILNEGNQITWSDGSVWKK